MDEGQLDREIEKLAKELDIRYPASLEFDEEEDLRVYYGDGMWGEVVRKKETLWH